MSNMGLARRLDASGLRLDRTPVGDRYVSERMRALGANVGGEQSGHVILTDHATTGDGLVAALQCLAVIVRSGEPASRALRLFDPFPQSLRSVTAPREDAQRPSVVRVVAEAERNLGQRGRVLVRPSGTEPVVRVMVEAEDAAEVQLWVDRICASISGAV